MCNYLGSRTHRPSDRPIVKPGLEARTWVGPFVHYVQALDKHRKGSDATFEIPDLINANSNDAEKALQEISKRYNEKVGAKDFADEAHVVLSTALKGLGHLHWVTAAFTVVVSVLTRLDQVAENREDALDILDILRQLGKQLVDLFKTLQNDDLFVRAASIIVEGAILSISAEESSYASRLAVANTSKRNLSVLKEKISLLYSDLNLTISKDLRRLISKPLQSYEANHPEHAVGLERIIADIVEILETTQQTVQQKTPAILLYGMGGIGKTTIGEAVCAAMFARRSLSTVRVEVGEKPSSDKICTCQSNIYERSCGEKQKIDIPSHGKNLLANCFRQCNSPMLLFVDNIFEIEDLEELLPRKLSLPEGSYILVTSRYEAVSQALDGGDILWKTYDVIGLERSGAEALLSQRLEGCPADKKEEFSSVLDLCGGWPLALEVVGSHLKSRKNDQRAWKSTIAQLRKGKDVRGRAEDQNKLRTILKWSYDQVDSNCKRVFLDVCCLLRNGDWDWISTLGNGSELDTLKALSLVKKVETPWEDMFSYKILLDYPRDEVKVHDLLVTLGQQESSFMGRLVRVHSDVDGDSISSILEALQSEDECKQVDGLVLQGKVSLPAERLDSIHGTLRILHLTSTVEIHGECHELPFNLQICSIDGGRFPYTMSYLPRLHDLRVLRLSSITNLNDFDRAELPKNLEVLQLSWIRSLKRFHVKAFENCNSLHTIRITSCDSLEELPDNIYLCPLRKLILHNNDQMKSMPLGFNRLQSLETLHFGGIVSALEEFPAGLTDFKKLREASIQFQGKSENVDFSQLAQLEHLLLDYGHSKAQQLHHGFGSMLSLQSLQVKRCTGLKQFSDDFSQLTALKTLSLSQCTSLKELPKGFDKLLVLSKLDLLRCESLEKLPEGIGNLTTLQILTLSSCKSLTLLPESVVHLTNLEQLYLGGLKLCLLPSDLGNLKALEYLDLSGCGNLEGLPKSMIRLERLKHFWLNDCRPEVQQSQVAAQLETGLGVRVYRYPHR